MHLRIRWIHAVALGLLASRAFADPLPAQFTLAHYIPQDAFLFVDKVRNPERAWVEDRWCNVWDAFVASGIDRDLTASVLSLLSDEDRAGTQASVERAVALIKAVRWQDLVAKELAFAERVTTTLPGYEYAFLARGKRATLDANVAGLVAILKEVASLSDRFTVARRHLKDTEVWSMRLTGVAREDFDFSVELFYRGDVIGIVIGSRMTKDILSLMAGESPRRVILAAPRFQEAVARVEAPEDSLVYSDVRLTVQEVAQLIERISASKSDTDRRKSDRKIHIVKKIIAMCDVIDYTVTTKQTDGRRVHTRTLTQFQPDKVNSPLARVFLDRRPFQRFDRYIPAEATGFRLSALIDLQHAYQIATDFIREEVPDGAGKLRRWDEMLASLGFDLEQDLFSWWSGEMMTVTLPTGVTTPIGGTDRVIIIRVKDTPLASQKINSAISFLRAKLQAKGQCLMVSPAAVQADGFRSVTHPALAMYLRPVIGVKDGWLFIGTSVDAINKCLAVAAGEKPSIMANERFQKEGLIPDGPVWRASFTDLSTLGSRLGGIAATAGMASGIALAAIPDEPGTHAPKRFFKTLVPIAMKLGPILQTIDFYSSQSTVTTFDGSALRSNEVVTYKAQTHRKDSKTTAGCKCRHR